MDVLMTVMDRDEILKLVLVTVLYIILVVFIYNLDSDIHTLQNRIYAIYAYYGVKTNESKLCP